MSPNRFVGHYLPKIFWPAQIAMFGSTVTYLPQGDAAQAVDIAVLWKDGASDEDMAPGRYSHIDVQNSDLAAPPAAGDMLLRDGKQYQAVRIDALNVGYSVVRVQEVGV